MKSPAIIALGAMLAVVCVAVPCSAHAQSATTASSQKGAGHWEGKVILPNQEVKLVVDIAKNASGAWVGTIGAPGTSMLDVPLVQLRVEEATVHFAATVPQLSTFEGTLSAKGDSLAGSATDPRGSAPFTLARTGDAKVNLPAVSSALTKEFEGVWEGASSANGQTRHLVLRLAPGTDGLATASLLSVENGSGELPATTVTIKGKELLIEIRSVTASLHGTLGESGELGAEWVQGPVRLAVTFKRAAAEGKPPR
jgi:hypothetical protein